MNLTILQNLLVKNGFEVYATEGSEVRLAERVRVHLMDSGVTIRLDGADTGGATGATVTFTMRSESSQLPGHSETEHFESVRRAATTQNAALGYREASSLARRIEDPGNPSDTLDTWYEVSFCRKLTDVSEDSILDALRECLARPKTTHRSGQ